MAKTERTAAQKKADAARSRRMKGMMKGRGGGGRSVSQSVKRYVKKNPSVSKWGTAAGIIVAATGIGATQAESLVDSVNDLLDEFGMDPITGALIVVVLIGLSVLATFNKWFGKKYTALLNKYDLRA